MTPIPKRDEVEAVALAALKRSVLAIDDWLNVYASELCNEQRVAEAHQRIGDAGGTIAYVAYVQADNRAAIAALDESRAREGDGWQIGRAPDDGTYLVANERGQVCPIRNGIITNNPGHADWDFGTRVTRWRTLPVPPSEITPAPGQSEAIRAEVIAQGVDPNSDKAERMGRAARQNMLRKATREAKP